MKAVRVVAGREQWIVLKKNVRRWTGKFSSISNWPRLLKKFKRVAAEGNVDGASEISLLRVDNSYQFASLLANFGASADG